MLSNIYPENIKVTSKFSKYLQFTEATNLQKKLPMIQERGRC